MGILNKLKEISFEAQLIKALNRQAAATERLSDIVESLLPSPLTSDRILSSDLKSASVDTYKVYDQREAYLDEQRQKLEELRGMMSVE